MKQKFDDLVEYLIANGFFLEQAVEILEKTLIRRALDKTDCNQTAASKLLGIHRNTLQRKMLEYQLDGRHPRKKPVTRAVAKKTASKRKGAA